MSTPTSELVRIPFKQIKVKPENNIRTGDLPRVRELAASMKANGQTTPVIVTNGGEGEQPYELVAGFCRAEAFKINGWQNREILAIVRTYRSKNVALQRFSDTWSENQDRQQLSPLDQAEAVGRLAEGRYGEEGKEEAPLSREEIVETLGITVDTARILDSIYKHLAPLAKELLRSKASTLKEGSYPIRRLRQWALLKDEEKQIEAIHAWLDEQKELAAEGRQRAKPAKAAKGSVTSRDEDEERPTAAVKPEKKAGQNKQTLAVHLEAALHAAGLEKGKAEKSYLEGIADGLRFVTGDLKKLPGVLKEHYDAIMPEEEEEGEEE